MNKKITRASVISTSSGNVIYTVPPASSASITGIFVTATAPTTITISNYVDFTGVTTTYSIDLQVGDNYSDTTVYPMAPLDFVKIESTNSATYMAFIEIP